MNREKRRESVRLSPVYYVLWMLLVVTSSVIPFFEWFFVEEPDCWTARYVQVMLSVFCAMMTGCVSAVLCLINVMSRGSISYWRLNFCTLCFIVLVLFSVFNFLVGIYFFALPTCYFAQITPPDQLDHSSTLFEIITVKYDLKIAGILHLFCSLFSFVIGIGFAIIKNNFKYVRQVDFD